MRREARGRRPPIALLLCMSVARCVSDWRVILVNAIIDANIHTK